MLGRLALVEAGAAVAVAEAAAAAEGAGAAEGVAGDDNRAGGIEDASVANEVAGRPAVASHRHRPRDGQPGGRMGVFRLRRGHAAPLRVGRRGRAGAGRCVQEWRGGKAMLAVLGDEGNRESSRPETPCLTVAARERFVAAYDDKHRLEAGGGKVVLVVGRQTSRSRSPSCRTARAGASTRRPARRRSSTGAFGEDEPNTIQVCLAYVDAQREYYAPRSRRRHTAAVRAEVRQQSRESGTGSTGRRTRVIRRARSGRSSPGRGARGTPSTRRTPSPTGATTTGS